MLAVLNRPAELKAHVRGALNNGCSEAEIREALLHATVYGGIPCGSEGFRIVREALDAIAAEDAA
jgi:4-carboxymuconolactone decarboxylase